ncbi:hypothetical protein MSG28_010723 [Choristoneura fumiferana]|uniref:Uncharacterized protein n=1 Tax=Choristoneura fumiferana TaxID=7141 RepID=A0ACC0KPK5_CHOFU|nr:hypothetical protein MSG28_010723 [Choristoneura fumiferana]
MEFHPLMSAVLGGGDEIYRSAQGMVFIAGFVVILSTFMFFFPRQIRQEPVSAIKKVKERSKPMFKDFFATIKRQLTNDILMWRTASSVLHLMPISGVYSFLPKYLEKQFRLTTHDANLVSGLGGILVMGLGIITSGVVILKLVPTARQVAAWTAATAAIYSAGMVLLMFVSCPEESYRALSAELVAPGAPGPLACSAGCHCADVPYSPVCGQDAYTYLSPCQAGCQAKAQVDNNTWLYYDCSCIPNNGTGLKAIAAFNRYELQNTSNTTISYDDLSGFAVTGECGGPCRQIYAFIAMFAALMFVHASGEVGAVLLIIRCTDKHDKAMAMGVIQFAIGVFGNVPCPILFGAAIDAACRTRDFVCGALGACASYDNDSLRHLFLGEWRARRGLFEFRSSPDVWRGYRRRMPNARLRVLMFFVACTDSLLYALAAAGLRLEQHASPLALPTVNGNGQNRALNKCEKGYDQITQDVKMTNLFGLSAGLMFLAFIMDLLVWSKAGRIDMNPGEPRHDAALARQDTHDGAPLASPPESVL